MGMKILIIKVKSFILKAIFSTILTPYNSIKQFIKKSDFYTDLRSKEMLKKGIRFRVLNLFVNPLVMFVKMYFIKKGFLDGLSGFILALSYSSLYTLMKYIKLWELENK
ncbi:hypothetical protein [Candidatus Endomicrobiellum trichonymphae]|uniref:hypothetical protein n=2 Tax=Endomicrobium trichonymphae TaxID=1408204 RepID=UPI0003217F57|nr:hypothetical protein [Candidatus Endomicrobium trichonymphae]